MKSRHIQYQSKRDVGGEDGGGLQRILRIPSFCLMAINESNLLYVIAQWLSCVTREGEMARLETAEHDGEHSARWPRVYSSTVLGRYPRSAVHSE